MSKIIGRTCYAVVILAGMLAFASHGATSKTELQQSYYRFFQQKDVQRLATLVYWEGVEQHERDGFFRLLGNDLRYRLQNVKFVPLDPSVKLEYTLGGVTYKPALPPIGRMVASYEDQDNVKHPSTSYLVGVKDGKYYIDLATPKRND
jgi:hypothetical protein